MTRMLFAELEPPAHTQSCEEWRAVVGFEGLYEVSSFGRVASIMFRNGATSFARRKILKATPVDDSGRLALSLSKNNITTRHRVHQLVAIAFIGPCPPDKDLVAHWDGDPSNNHLSNLRWATHVENEADKKRHGRNLAGEKNHAAKMTATLVAQLRHRNAAGETVVALAAESGVSTSTLLAALTGESWKHAGGPIREPIKAYGAANANSRLNDGVVVEIRLARDAGASCMELGERYGVSGTMISNIVKRKAWKHVA